MPTNVESGFRATLLLLEELLYLTPGGFGVCALFSGFGDHIGMHAFHMPSITEVVIDNVTVVQEAASVVFPAYDVEFLAEIGVDAYPPA